MTLEFSPRDDPALEREGYVPIAITDEGEVAYYKEPNVEEIRAMDPKKRKSLMRIRKKQMITSESGGEWLPDFLALGRATCFVAGCPGAGKSYFIARCLELFPEDYQVMLFTALTEDDGNFSDLPQKIFKVKMVPETLRKINLASLRRCSKNIILVFDDFDCLPKGTILSETQRILHDALANGRAHTTEESGEDTNIHVFVSSDSLNDFRRTKYSIENSDYIVMFPRSTTFAQLVRLGTKIGLTQAQITEMRNSGERAVIVHKTPPLYVIEGPSLKTI